MIVMDEQLYTVREVAARLRVSEYTVREWLRGGRLKGYRPGGTKAGWRVSDAEVRRFLTASGSDDQ